IKLSLDLMVSPGSVVLFPAILVAVLFIYAREEAKEGWWLIYALLAADLVVAVLGLLIVQHFNSSLLFNPYNLPPDLFIQQPRIVVVGTLALYADTILIVLVYEFVARYIRTSLLPRITISLVTVLAFDTVLFVTGSFVESPAYGSILLSGLLGKTFAGLFYAVILAIYLRCFDVSEHAPLGAQHTLGDLFQVLTYRQKYEELRAQITRDALTGIYNRAFFDETLASLVARSHRTGSPVTLLMIDIDPFKQVHDTYGHREGDQALQAVAASIAATTRTSDLVCRYGGEEFTVLLPDTDLQQAINLAERICRELPAALSRHGARWSKRRGTPTVGPGRLPAGAGPPGELSLLAGRPLSPRQARGP